MASRRGHRGGRGRRDRLDALAAQRIQSDRSTHEMHAEIEGVDLGDPTKIELKGRWFRIDPRTGFMPLLAFAKVASQGIDANDLVGLARIYDMLHDAIYSGRPACGSCPACTGTPPTPTRCPEYEAGDWDAFYTWASECKAQPDDLLDVVRGAVQKRGAFPTGSRSDSPSGSRTTSPSSRSTSPPVASEEPLRPHSTIPEPPGGFMSVETLMSAAERGEFGPPGR